MDQEVVIESGGVRLRANLHIPAAAEAIIIFAHGSGSGRNSPRNQYVAFELQNAGLGTLLLDLLTTREEASDAVTGALRFDIPFLARRLSSATAWVVAQERLSHLAIGYFGASTGAAAALVAAAEEDGRIGAIVSRGGRPDLAGDSLDRVHAPTLLIVGASDEIVLQLNREAFSRLRGQKRLTIIPGATHLFQEPGALEEVSHLARGWFTDHLTGAERNTGTSG